MSLRKKKKPADTVDAADTATDQLSHFDRLVALRRDISGQSAVTDLLDILIDERGGMPEEEEESPEDSTVPIEDEDGRPDEPVED